MHVDAVHEAGSDRDELDPARGSMFHHDYLSDRGLGPEGRPLEEPAALGGDERKRGFGVELALVQLLDFGADSTEDRSPLNCVVPSVVVKIERSLLGMVLHLSSFGRARNLCLVRSKS